jgi:hypothetical protein
VAQGLSGMRRSVVHGFNVKLSEWTFVREIADDVFESPRDMFTLRTGRGVKYWKCNEELQHTNHLRLCFELCFSHRL